MFEKITNCNKTEYFKDLGQRSRMGVVFLRLIGYDQEEAFLAFLQQFYTAVQASGAFLKEPLKNPSELQLNEWRRIAPGDVSLTPDAIWTTVSQWLPFLSAQGLTNLSDALYESLCMLKNQGANENIMKNTYIKWMCWLRYYFEKPLRGLGAPQVPKLLYIGDISKYELWMLHTLSRAGCDIAYVHYTSEESYLKTDPRSLFSTPIYGSVKAVPARDFRQVDFTHMQKTQEMKSALAQMEGFVCTNTWLHQSFLDALFSPSSLRSGGSSKQILNLFIRYIGIDNNDEYYNRLFHLREKLKQSAKQSVLITEKIANPTLNETARIKRPEVSNKQDLLNGLALQLGLTSSKVQNYLIQQGFLKIMEQTAENNLSKLFNQGVQLICWLLRYGLDLFAKFDPEHAPAVVYYGMCTAKEADFLCMLSLMGIDVIYICPDKTGDAPFAQHPFAKHSILEQLPISQPVQPYPLAEVKVRRATAAYAAEQELKTILYTDDTGMFKDRQFKRSNPVTLKTTLDELYLLWKEAAKFRPSFQVEQNRVTVPNIFVKICGVPNKNTGPYLDKIRTMMTQDDTLFIRRFPFLSHKEYLPELNALRQCLRGNSLLPDAIKKSPFYNYDYINEDTQDYMLEKMQELIQLNWIQHDEPHLTETILLTLLNIDRPILRLIQGFDFTGKIPKVIILSTDENMCSLEDCIFLSFLNLIGFDIAVFTPTGYRNIEKYIKADAYEEYTAGTFVYGMTVPQHMTPKEEENSNGFLNRLFNKGRT